jgi:hypothetical protein
VIPYNGKNYYIDIIEVKPDSAVSVVETDVEVDFAPPKDYKEPDYKAIAAPAAAATAPSMGTSAAGSIAGTSADGSQDTGDGASDQPKFTAFSGVRLLHELLVLLAADLVWMRSISMSSQEIFLCGAVHQRPDMVKLESADMQACAGRGNRIDGKASAAPATSPSAPAATSARTTEAQQGRGSNGGLKAGTHVFGNGSSAPSIPGNRLAARLAKKTGDGRPPPPQPPKQAEKVEEPNFVPFAGKGRSLKD